MKGPGGFHQLQSYLPSIGIDRFLTASIIGSTNLFILRFFIASPKLPTPGKIIASQFATNSVSLINRNHNLTIPMD